MLLCSYCHTRFEPADSGHSVCPKCKAEAGLEPMKATAKPMKLFGAFLATAGLVVVVVAGAVAAAN